MCRSVGSLPTPLAYAWRRAIRACEARPPGQQGWVDASLNWCDPVQPLYTSPLLCHGGRTRDVSRAGTPQFKSRLVSRLINPTTRHTQGGPAITLSIAPVAASTQPQATHATLAAGARTDSNTKQSPILQGISPHNTQHHEQAHWINPSNIKSQKIR